MKILVTGVAGSIGSEVASELLARGDEVVGVDCFTPYYNRALKHARLGRLYSKPGFRFEVLDVADTSGFRALCGTHKPDRMVHLAAQPGVRYSISHPQEYLHCNIDGFLSVLEACRYEGVQHLVYASSSSVYGLGGSAPCKTTNDVEHPISLYAATKKSNELMAHSYSHLYGVPTTGLRLFTVYGPWGRPDMSVYSFADRIARGVPIELYHFGKHKRDFTYVRDVAHGILRVLDKVSAGTKTPYRVYNLGNSAPVEVSKVVSLLEAGLGRTATVLLKEMQPGDVESTFADMTEFRRDFGFSPTTTIEEGIHNFVRWFRDYHRLEKRRVFSLPDAA